MLILCDFAPTQEHPAQFYFPGETLAPVTLEDIRAAAPPLRPGQLGWMVVQGYRWSDLPDCHTHIGGRQSLPRPDTNMLTTHEHLWSYLPIIGAGYVPSAPQAASGWPAQAYSISRLRERPPEPTRGEPRASHAGREWEDVAEGGRLMAQQMYWSVFPGRKPCWVSSYGNWPFAVGDWGRAPEGGSMSEDPERGPGRPRKEEGARKNLTLQASIATGIAWRQAALERGISLADLFAAMGRALPALLLWEREARRRGVPLSQLLEERAEGFPKVTVI